MNGQENRRRCLTAHPSPPAERRISKYINEAMVRGTLAQASHSQARRATSLRRMKKAVFSSTRRRYEALPHAKTPALLFACFAAEKVASSRNVIARVATEKQQHSRNILSLPSSRCPSCAIPARAAGATASAEQDVHVRHRREHGVPVGRVASRIWSLTWFRAMSKTVSVTAVPRYTRPGSTIYRAARDRRRSDGA